MTIQWFTDGDRAERARIAREQVERGELLRTFARWLSERQGHDGPVTVPKPAWETEARLIRLLRDGSAPPAS